VFILTENDETTAEERRNNFCFEMIFDIRKNMRFLLEDMYTSEFRHREKKEEWQRVQRDFGSKI